MRLLSAYPVACFDRLFHQEGFVLPPAFYEVVSLSGTVALTGHHVHVSVSDGDGKTVGGHLLKVKSENRIPVSVVSDFLWLQGSLVYTTLELAILSVKAPCCFWQELHVFLDSEKVFFDKARGQGVCASPRSDVRLRGISDLRQIKALQKS